MKTEIIEIYKQFNIDKLDVFFDRLIEFISKYHSEFEKYTVIEFLEGMETLDSSELYLGTSDDNLELGISNYTITLINKNNREICGNVLNLVWDIATFQTNEKCPSCQDDNLKITSSVDRRIIYKRCDNCLITMIKQKFIDRPEEMIPATKHQVDTVERQKTLKHK